MEKYSGYKFIKTTIINPRRSANPFAKISYEELQPIALMLNLPANLQHKVLLALVLAKMTGRQDIVCIILKTHRHRPRLAAPNLGNTQNTLEVTPSCSFNGGSKSFVTSGPTFENHPLSDVQPTLGNNAIDTAAVKGNISYETQQLPIVNGAQSKNNLAASQNCNDKSYHLLLPADEDNVTPPNIRNNVSIANNRPEPEHHFLSHHTISVPLNSNVSQTPSRDVNNFPSLPVPSTDYGNDLFSDWLLDDEVMPDFPEGLNIEALDGSSVMEGLDDVDNIDLLKVLETLSKCP